MSDAWINIDALKSDLAAFFSQEQEAFSQFGNTVNQTFEAFVLASVVAWYKHNGWHIQVMNPFGSQIKLKFSTHGKPSCYSYFVCRNDSECVEIRHQLRVATKAHRDSHSDPANICLDVAVVKPIKKGHSMRSDDWVENDQLVTFAEAKHMSAFAELIANFIGMVHELQPGRLKRTNKKSRSNMHPCPFLYVSGMLYRTARGLKETIAKRQYDLDIFNSTKHLVNAFQKITGTKLYFEKSKETQIQ